MPAISFMEENCNTTSSFVITWLHISIWI